MHDVNAVCDAESWLWCVPHNDNTVWEISLISELCVVVVAHDVNAVLAVRHVE